MALEEIVRDLVSYYKLSEAAGGDRIDSATDNDLSEVVSTVAQGASIVTNADGASASFDGVGEYLSKASPSLLNTGAGSFTISFWARIDGSLASNQGAVSKFTPTGDQRQFIVFFFGASTATWRFGVSSDGLDDFGVNDDDVITATGETHFVLAWYDGAADTINIQVDDGTVLSAAGPTAVHQGTAGLDVGRADIGVEAVLNGVMEEVAIWRRVLTSAERTSLYNGGDGVNLSDFFPQAKIGGYIEGAAVGSISEFIGGFELSRGFIGPTGFLGGFCFARAVPGDELSEFLGGLIKSSEAVNVGPAFMGGFCNSQPVTSEDPRFIGGFGSGLFQNGPEFIGGFAFGRPDVDRFVAARGRTIAVATSENVLGQELNIDAQIIFQQIADNQFNARLINVKTFESDFNAKVDVEKFQIPPSIFIQSVTLVPGSGEVLPSGQPVPNFDLGGARQVCVTVSGFLNDGDQFIGTQIDFGDPFRKVGDSFKPSLSISGFTGNPPWTACHDYDMSGIYFITARAQDNRGMVGSAASGLNLASGATPGIHFPLINISGVPRFGQVPASLQVNFTIRSSGLSSPPHSALDQRLSKVQSPTDDRLLWQFGNRERSTKTNPVTFYQSPGLFAPKAMFRFDNPLGFGRFMVSDSLLLGFNI